MEAVQEIKKLMERAMQESGSCSIDLFVLPELCPIGYSEDSFANYLPTLKVNKELHREIDEAMKEAAATFRAAVCYGAMGQTPDGKVTIRQLVVNKDGVEVGVYDKIHVCDYGDCAETRFFAQGAKLVSFSLAGDWKFGLLICADMRYPELAQRYIRNHGVHVFLQPAAFSRDCSFRTWKSFRETRAVETGSYFLAVNYAGGNFGETSVNPPWIDKNNEPTVLGSETSYLLVNLDPEELEAARQRFPFFQNSSEPKQYSDSSQGD